MTDEKTVDEQPTAEADDTAMEAMFNESADRLMGREPDRQQPAEAPAAAADEPSEEPEGEADDEPAEQGESSDPWASLPESTRGFFETLRDNEKKLREADRAHRGHISALSKKLNQLERQVNQGSQPGQKVEQTDEANEDASAAELDRQYRASLEEYSDVLAPTAKVVEGLKRQIDTLTASVSRFEEHEDRQKTQEAYAALETAHPDFRDYSLTANTAFKEWAEQQPASVQGLVTSFDPQEVSLALTLYKAEHGAAAQGAPAPRPMDQRRERQLQGSRQVSARNANQSQHEASDEAIFAAEAKKLTRRNL